jgi:diguanylate cyclase (GGDEF)-like protein/PAS domain S-box-containing protein
VSVEDITELKAARERVRAEADRFEAMLASMPVTVFTYDLDGVCTSSRGQALKLLGVDENEFVGAALPHLGTTPPAMRDALLTSLTGGEVQLDVDLADRVWECHYRPVRDTDGAIQGGIGIAVDVTTRMRAEREVRANEARLRALLREADDVVVVIDVQGRLMYVSPAVCRVLGYDDATLFWHPAKELNHPDDRATVARAWREVLHVAGSAATFVCRVLHEDGSWRWCEHVITNLIADPDVGGMVVNLRDVSERRRAEHEVQRLALHDALTGLPNRFLLLDRIGQALTAAKQQEQRTGLILLGVVGMTRINELLGHVGGDAVLRSVGERLSDAVRATDSVARVSGDRFAVLIEDVASAEDLRARAASLLSVAQGPFALGDVITEVHLRVGSAMCPAVDAGSLLSAAERALTQANGAPGIVVAQVAVEQDGRSDRAAQAELRRAVEQGELRLHFQPVLSLSTGEVAGAEALVRWQHPERGLLPPSEFIPLAESSGLIVEVGTWVLREACTRLVQWQTAGQSFGVGINLSPRQMVGGELIDVLRQILDETGASADQLMLEVTESAVMDDPKAADVLRELRGLGVKLALDDFGTGYSSLTYLRRFPIDAIKIDRSFVSGLGRNGDDEAIVASVVSLGRAVGKTLVAEGVETAGQLHALRALGVDQAQGFLWSAALPAEELVEWAVNHTWSEAHPPAPPVARPAVPTFPMGDSENRIVQLHEAGASLHTIAAALNAEGSRTDAGPRWTTTTVARIVAARAGAI